MLKDKKEQVQYNSTTTAQKLYTVHYKTHMGRRHLVIPLVMMVEGVHHGSAGPVFHSSTELAKFPESWNGIPVVVGHPNVNGASVSANSPTIIDSLVVGRIYNTHFTRGKLKAEAWLDESKTNSIAPTLITHLTNAQALEVSMGAFSDEEDASGTWKGEAYTLVSHNYRPDHLALLPGDTGACSCADGCGVRTNGDKDTGGNTVDKKLWWGMLEAGYNVIPLPENILQSNQMGYKEITQVIQHQLDQRDNSERTHYLEEIYEDSFIYRVDGRNDYNRPMLFKCNYTISEAGELTMDNNPMEVIRKVEYTDVVQPQLLQTKTFVRTKGVKETDEMGTNEENKDCKPCAKVEQLLQLNNFKAEDATWLGKLEESALDRLIVVHTAMESKPEPKVDEKKEAEPQANVAPVQMNEEQVLAALSPERRQQLEHGMTLYREHRESLVKRITTNTQVYSTEELGAMDVGALEKLAQVIKPVANYALNGGGANPQVNVEEPPLVPANVVVK